MKVVALLSFLVFISIQSVAQYDKSKLFYAQKSERYRKMKQTGTLLTLAGGVLLVVGISLIANSSITTTYPPGGGAAQTTTTGNPGAGALAFVGGMAGLGAGIPLWIVGAKKQKRYDAFLERVSIGFSPGPQKRGLTLIYHF